MHCIKLFWLSILEHPRWTDILLYIQNYHGNIWKDTSLMSNPVGFKYTYMCTNYLRKYMYMYGNLSQQDTLLGHKYVQK